MRYQDSFIEITLPQNKVCEAYLEKCPQIRMHWHVHCFLRHPQCEGGSPYGISVDVTSLINWVSKAQSGDIIAKIISDFLSIRYHWTITVWVIV